MKKLLTLISAIIFCTGCKEKEPNIEKLDHYENLQPFRWSETSINTPLKPDTAYAKYYKLPKDKAALMIAAPDISLVTVPTKDEYFDTIIYRSVKGYSGFKEITKSNGRREKTWYMGNMLPSSTRSIKIRTKPTH
jgi:hypothetical protein